MNEATRHEGNHRLAGITAAIVIPTFRREGTLCQTIEDVLALDPLPDEVWVIDQSEEHTQDTAAFLKRVEGKTVHIVRLSKPGVCFARNLGAALATTDIVIFIDDDVRIPEKDFVLAHKRNYIDPRVHVVWGQILDRSLATTDRAKGLNGAPQNYSVRREGISQLVSANHSIRKSTMLESGGYDESYSGRTYANEDGDLGLRLKGMGYRIDFDPEASLVHLLAPSGGNRLPGKDDFPEWTRSVTFYQFALRHYGGIHKVLEICRVLVRVSLRKENRRSVFRLASALVQSLFALGRAMRRNREGFRSSLIRPGPEMLIRRFGTA